MEKKLNFRRILIEEAIRLMALEVVIGLPPVGITSATGASPELLNMIAAVSLTVPRGPGDSIGGGSCHRQARAHRRSKLNGG